MAFIHWNCPCSRDKSHTIRSPQRGSPSCCKIFCAAAFFLKPYRMCIPCLHKQLGALVWWAHALAYFPFQSYLWLWHSTASLLVMWSRAMLTEIVDAWNSLQPTGHFGFAVDLVSCLRQTRIPNPEWPQLQLPGFNMALKLYGLGKKSIIIVSLEYTTLFHVMCNLPTYCIVIVGLWNQ